jgi:3-isopropylmalate dehydrogenase
MAKTHNIAVLGGDGTGPEVVREGIKVLKAAASIHGFGLKFKNYDFGGERYLATGKIIDDTDIETLKQHDAIFLGAIGHPGVKPGILEKGLLLRLRFALDQYINLRPVKLFPGVETPLKNKGPEHIDYVVVRENSGGAYTGCGGNVMLGTPNEVATQEMIYTRFQVERALRYAFDLVRRRHTRKQPWRGLSEKDVADGKIGQLTLSGKTNVLTFVFGLWERAFNEIAKEYPDVKTDYCHVDATTMWMVKNPEWFDVIVTENLFGDIITDLGAMTQGGMGIAAGGNINPKGLSMFEPIGGSAPKYTGLNVINPMAAICAGAMMLETLGEEQAAAAIEAAVAQVTPLMKSQAAGKMGFSTTEVGDEVVKALKAAKTRVPKKKVSPR